MLILFELHVITVLYERFDRWVNCIYVCCDCVCKYSVDYSSTQVILVIGECEFGLPCLFFRWISAGYVRRGRWKSHFFRHLFSTCGQLDGRKCNANNTFGWQPNAEPELLSVEKGINEINGTVKARRAKLIARLLSNLLVNAFGQRDEKAATVNLIR